LIGAFYSVGGTILAAPITMPIVVSTAAGYFAVAGGVLSAVSQLTSEPNRNEASDNQP
jgi:hypothetical protein